MENYSDQGGCPDHTYSAAGFTEEKEPEREPVIDWKAIEAQAEKDLQGVRLDADAVAFIEKYLSKELRPTLLQLYRSDRREMGRTPRQAIDNILSLPPNSL